MPRKSYGHRISAIHANPKNMCDHCPSARAVGNGLQVFSGEHANRSSNPEQVCDTHAKQFAAKWPSAEFPPRTKRCRPWRQPGEVATEPIRRAWTMNRSGAGPR